MQAINVSKDCFNSTLVQLKGSTWIAENPAEQCFNSTLVQLKVVRTRLHNDSQECFNSTLVQLKVVIEVTTTAAALEFQFYLSSIKRQVAAIMLRTLASFNSTLVQLKERRQ